MLKIIDNLRRKRAIRNITGNQGFVVETEDKIICYIQKEKCKKEKSYYEGVTTYCIRLFNEKYREILEKKFQDKKLVYVLDGLDFKENVKIISGEDCDLEIKNCKFSGNLEISTYVDNCIIKNTSVNPSDINGEIYIVGQRLVIDNVRIGQTDNQSYPYFRKACISAIDLVEVKNSKIGIGDIILGRGTKCINVINSILSAKDISIWSQKISSKSSQLIANNKLEIKTDDFDSLKVKTPFIHFDGVFLNHRDGSKFYSLKPTNEKQNYRRAIIEQLKRIKGNLEEQRRQILDGVGKQIDSQRVARLYQRVRKQRG